MLGFFLSEIWPFEVQSFNCAMDATSRVELQQHTQALGALCRICGRILTSQRVTYPCSSHADTLRAVFKIVVTKYEPNIHPNNCYRALQQHKQNEEDMKDYNCSITLVHWKGHDLNCATCTMYQDKRKGGRPPKTVGGLRGM